MATEAAPSNHDAEVTATGLPDALWPATLAAILVGAVGALLGLAGKGDEPWWAFLTAFVFWAGLGQGIFMWGAILRTGTAVWAGGPNRLARAAAGYQVFVLVMIAVLYIGREHWLWVAWGGPEVVHKAWWLNEGFLFARQFIALGLMAITTLVYLGQYRLGETVSDPDPDGPERPLHFRINSLSVLLVLMYAGFYTVFAWDFIMSLSPHWFSTLFGAEYIINNQTIAMAALILLASYLKDGLGLQRHFEPRHFRDMANMLLGFTFFSGGLAFAENLTIWYGNLPEETPFLITRVFQYPWRGVAWLCLFLCYFIPFFLLQPPLYKGRHRYLRWPAFCLLIGYALHRWLLVMPSFSPHALNGITLVGVCSNLFFGGVLLAVILISLRRHPAPSPLDTALKLY